MIIPKHKADKTKLPNCKSISIKRRSKFTIELLRLRTTKEYIANMVIRIRNRIIEKPISYSLINQPFSSKESSIY